MRQLKSAPQFSLQLGHLPCLNAGNFDRRECSLFLPEDVYSCGDCLCTSGKQSCRVKDLFSGASLPTTAICKYRNVSMVQSYIYLLGVSCCLYRIAAMSHLFRGAAPRYVPMVHWIPPQCRILEYPSVLYTWYKILALGVDRLQGSHSSHPWRRRRRRPRHMIIHIYMLLSVSSNIYASTAVNNV